MDAVCPVCGAAGGLTPPSAPALRKSTDRLADKIGLVPDQSARVTLFQGVIVAATAALGAAGLGMIGGWPLGILAGAVVGLSVGGLMSLIRGLRRR